MSAKVPTTFLNQHKGTQPQKEIPIIMSNCEKRQNTYPAAKICFSLYYSRKL